MAYNESTLKLAVYSLTILFHASVHIFLISLFLLSLLCKYVGVFKRTFNMCIGRTEHYVNFKSLRALLG